LIEVNKEPDCYQQLATQRSKPVCPPPEEDGRRNHVWSNGHDDVAAVEKAINLMPDVFCP
jgi:hypothetical protein